MQEDEKPKVDYNKAGNETVMVPLGVDLLEEKKMPLDLVNFDTTNAGAGLSDPRVARGLRMFATPIEPGQTLTLQLRATPMVNYNINWLYPQDRKDPLYSKIKLATDNQVQRKSPTISMKNTTKEQYLILFAVGGMAEQPYSVKITRK
jgi:hypothetical protein